MKTLIKNTTTTTGASNAPAVTVNDNTKTKEVTNMTHPNNQTAKQPKLAPKHVSVAEIEASKKKVEDIVCGDRTYPHSRAEIFLNNLELVPAFERSRIADIYNVRFNDKAIDGSNLDSLDETMPMLCAILSFLKTQSLFCHTAIDWLKKQVFHLLDDAKENPHNYAGTSESIPFDIADSETPRELHDEVVRVLSLLPGVLSARLRALEDSPYGTGFVATCFERRIANLLRLSMAFDSVWGEMYGMFEAGAFSDEIATTKLVATKK